MGRPSLREKIVESGVTTLHERGFAAAGIREIAAAAGVPQGSFTNHFRSKEAFGLAVLERYLAKTEAIVDATLRDGTRAPVERLRAYFDAVGDLLEGAGWRYGCLIGNMSLEAPEHSELLRLRLGEIFRSLAIHFAEAIRAGQVAGTVRDDLEPGEAAEFVLAAWQGAMLRMKVDRSPEPLARFKRMLLDTLLVAPGKPKSESHGRTRETGVNRVRKTNAKSRRGS